VRAIAAARRGLIHVRAALPHVRSPTLLLHSRTDHVVAPENMDLIYQAIGSTRKEKVWLERGDHIITEDADREQVFKRVATFLAAHTQ
jgi:carboxylesterase